MNADTAVPNAKPLYRCAVEELRRFMERSASIAVVEGIRGDLDRRRDPEPESRELVARG
jgi:hypothetical protein